MSFFRRHGPGWWIRFFGLALLDGIVIALIPTLWEQRATVALVCILVGAAGINYIFLSSRTIPIRWLVPGLFFLALMMLWPIVFTVYIALTNWSTGNFITKDQAIDRLTEGGAYLIETEDSPLAAMYLYRDPSIPTTRLDPIADLKLLVVTDLGEFFYGSPRLRTAPAPDEPELECCVSPRVDEEHAARLGAESLAELNAVDEDGDGIPETIGGHAKLRLLDIGTVSGVLDQLVLDVPGRGQARARTFSSAVLAEQRFVYDRARDALIDRLNDDALCPAQGASFVCAERRVDPGWREFQGFDNFTRIVGDERIRTPFLRIFVWNVIFAAAVVLLQLSLGMALALTLDDRRMKGRGLYRSLLLIPWAAPGFIVILVWRGLLNPSFGPVNNQLEARWLADLSRSTWPRWLVAVALVACAAVLIWMASGMLRRRRWFATFFSLVGAAVVAWFVYKILGPGFAVRNVGIPWVQPGDWFWSKVAVIVVTMWQGFPYFFLICTGALQAIPSEMKEAAKVDGASPFQVFWKVTFPLLMVGIAPLLIASFAFNFNAFVNIFLLTAGGPPVAGYAVPFGETDILISFVFNLAVESGRGGQYALAAAATFFIFFIVATISAISFRFTRRLEEIYGSL